MNEVYTDLEKKLTPPKEVERTFTFTYSHLHLFLRIFGTDVAVTAQSYYDSPGKPTCHSDTYVYGIVSKYIENADKYKPCK